MQPGLDLQISRDDCARIGECVCSDQLGGQTSRPSLRGAIAATMMLVQTLASPTSRIRSATLPRGSRTKPTGCWCRASSACQRSPSSIGRSGTVGTSSSMGSSIASNEEELDVTCSPSGIGHGICRGSPLSSETRPRPGCEAVRRSVSLLGRLSKHVEMSLSLLCQTDP